MVTRSLILIVLLVVAALGKAQEYILSDKECTESIYDGPLSSHKPIKYDLRLEIKFKSHVGASLDVTLEADYSADPEEPRDIIVVHADKSVEMLSLLIDRVSETKTKTKSKSLFEELPNGPVIESTCRDSAKQLLIIKLKDKLDIKAKLFLNFFGIRMQVRDDQKGLHRVAGGLLRANFANKEARLVIPCFDDPEYKSIFKVHLLVSKWFNRLTVAGLKPYIEVQERRLFPRTPFARRISLDKVSFDLKSNQGD